MTAKTLTQVCCLCVGTLTLSAGCRFQISGGYSFDYRGETAVKTLDGAIDPSIRSIRIENRFGDVDVSATTDDATWTWSGTCWASAQNDADSFVSQLKVQTTQVGDELLWKVVLPESARGLRGVESNLTLKLPASISLAVDVEHGDVMTDSLEQGIVLRTRHGETVVDAQKGEASIDSAFGNVKVNDSLAGLDIQCQHGSILVSEAKASMSLQSSHGDVKVVNAQADVTATTAHSDIEIFTVGPSVQCESQHGDVMVSVNGSEFESLVANLQHSDITVIVPPDVKPRVQFGVQFGETQSDFEPSESSDAPIININAQHGDITLRAGDTELTTALN